MRIEKNISTALYGDRAEEKQKAELKNGKMYAGNLNLVKDPVTEKMKEARKKAYKVVSDAWDSDKSVDKQIEDRQAKMDKYSKEANELQEKIKGLDEKEAAINEFYGEDNDSDEKKAELAEVAIARAELGKSLREANNGVVRENSMIREMNKERLKSNPVLDAKKEADSIMDAAHAEVKGMLMQESIDHVDEENEKIEEAAKKKAEEKKEQEEKLEAAKEDKEKQDDSISETTEDIVEMDVNSDVKKEVENIMNKMNLIVEDIKGIAVDENL